MKIGDVVIYASSHGRTLTTGKSYVIMDYQAKDTGDHRFNWPAYIQVYDDCGELSWRYAECFKTVEDQA